VKGLSPQPHGTRPVPGDIEIYRQSLPLYVIIEVSPEHDNTQSLASERCGGSRLVHGGSYTWNASHSKRMSGGRSRQLWRPKCIG
jgi:hypothetical protein